jgi:hypothetical protein
MHRPTWACLLRPIPSLIKTVLYAAISIALWCMASRRCTLNTAAKTPDGKNNLNEFVQKWRAKYYHKPQDDINGIFDFDAGRKYAQLNFLIGYLVADTKERPTWNKGDIFENNK